MRSGKSSRVGLLPPVCLVVFLAVVGEARADLLDAVNDLRIKGCGPPAATLMPLRAMPGLDDVARKWSKGGRLSAAFEDSDYRATSSSSMQIKGSKEERLIAKTLRENYCSVLTDPTFSEIGIFRSNDEVWFVVAAPFSAPAANDASIVGRRVLELVNAARASGRQCGDRSMRAAKPLKLSAMLTQAALSHAHDMVRHSHFAHRGTDGSLPAERITRTGYRWNTVGENIAAGAQSAEQVVQGWLNSPGHCVNIMGSQYTQMGLAFAADPKSDSGIYWAQVFARPR